MVKKSSLVFASLLAVIVAYTVVSAEKEFNAKCPVSGKPAVETSSVDYNGGKVYFCCENCPTAFGKNTKKFEAKANHQLVATGQAKQKACPITGRPMNPAQTISVAGVDVTPCCGNCKAKLAKAQGDAQLNLAFSEAAFKKGFEVTKKE